MESLKDKKIMTNKELKFEDVPTWWAVCTNHECGLRERCLRHHAALVAPPTVTAHLCIINHDHDDNSCPHFVENSTVRLARGFSTIFERVGYGHYKAMKRDIMAYLGSVTSKGTYYRYLHGERPLSPEQQAWFSRLMQQYGYSPEITFDSYVDDFVFKAQR